MYHEYILPVNNTIQCILIVPTEFVRNTISLLPLLLLLLLFNDISTTSANATTDKMIKNIQTNLLLEYLHVIYIKCINSRGLRQHNICIKIRNSHRQDFRGDHGELSFWCQVKSKTSGEAIFTCISLEDIWCISIQSYPKFVLRWWSC